MSLADARAADEFFAKHRADLKPFRYLKRADPPAGVRARMAEFLQHRYAATQQITADDLKAAGFTQADVTKHFEEALRIAGLTKQVA